MMPTPWVTEVAAYAPHWNPVELDCKYVTLDLQGYRMGSLNEGLRLRVF